MLGVAPKTLRHWLSTAQMEPTGQGTDSRLKLLTLEQVYQLAILHRRPILPSGDPGSEADVSTSLRLPAEKPISLEPVRENIQRQEDPSLSQEEELRGKLSHMEARLATVQEQLTHLALSLVQERDLRYERRITALEALVVQPLAQGRSSQELQERGLPSKLDAGDRLGRCPHPAEKRTRSLLPVIEYGAEGLYVIISPQEGELQLTPDSPEWFAWLASLASFRFVGKQGRMSVYRGYDHGPTRSWYAYRYIHQRNYKHQLGTTEHLTLTRLEQAAGILQSHVVSL